MRVRMVLFVIFLTMIVVNSVKARDVTGLVKKYTSLDQQIRQACDDYCKGNRRSGYLKYADITPSGATQYKVMVVAELVNKHNTGAILGIGGGVGWSYTVSIRAYGTLNASNCKLRIDNINVENDRIGIGKLAKGQEGKVYTIDNCSRLL